jgi:hypothetical protein
VASGGGSAAGSSASASVRSRTVRPPPRACASTSCTRCEASASAATPGRQLDAPRADGGGDAAHERRLADALGAADQHAQPGRPAEAREQLGPVQRELQPLGQPSRGRGVADEVGDRDDVRDAGRLGARGRRRAGRVAAGAAATGAGTDRSRVGGARAVHPADDRAGPHRHGPGRLDVGHRQQLGGPAAPERAGDAAAGRHRVQPRGRLEVLRQQRHGVAAGQDLAGEGQPQRLRRHGGAGQARPR